jgi:D-alanyl-D-alanine carboxypeptidase
MMRKTSHGLACFVWLAVAASVGAAPVATAAPERPATGVPRLQRALDGVVAAGVPGAVLLVRDGDRRVRLTSGRGRLRRHTAMRAGDRFRVGSITKAFVATVALQLAGGGTMTLEDSVERWLPGLVPNGAGITVRQLLNHTSGLFDYGGDDEFLAQAVRDPLRDWAPREIVAIATAHPPHFAPGADWSYSNTNYYVLGLIVEAATGRPLATELRRRIFAPLRLRATSLPAGPRIAGPHAHGYFVSPLEDVTVGSPSIVWASGGLVSNARDLARFFRALLGGRLLRGHLLRAMETTIAGTPEFSYGLGLEKVPGPCGALWGHTGGMPGYAAHSFNSRDGKRQVVVLLNATERLAPSLDNFRSFNTPRRAAPAFERLVKTVYCRQPKQTPPRRRAVQRAERTAP